MNPVREIKTMNSILFYFLLLAFLDFAIVQALLISARLTKNHTLAFYGRSIASFTALALCAVYGTIASACLNVAGYGGLGQWTTAKSFKYCMLLFTGTWFEIQDQDDWLHRTRPAVFVGNHQTELDVLFLGHCFPPYCVVTAKRSLRFVPVLGWFSESLCP